MDDKTREAAAIAAALMLARFAHLHFRHDPDLPLLRLDGYLHAPEPKLLLVPATTAPAFELIDEAVAALDADALIVCADARDAASIRFDVVLRGERPSRFAPLRLWLGAGAPAHLVPDETADSCVALLRVGLRACEVPPWDGEMDRQAGLALGLTELTRVLEGR